MMGIAGLYRAPDKMTRLQKENGLGRILRSSAGCAIFTFAALLGDCVFLLAGSRAREEWPGTLMLLLAAALSCFTVRRFRGKDQLAVREEVSA